MLRANGSFVQADADEIQAKLGSDLPIAVLGENPNERNILQAMQSLQVGSRS
jgi:hypothetical protein